MNTSRLRIFFLIVFLAPLVLMNTSQAYGASSIPPEVDRFARKISKDPTETCKAILNIELKKVSKIDRCKKGGSYKVRKIEGKDCDPDKRGHYTLYSGVCQCNGSKHSELLVLKDKPRIDEMTNYANPCVNCYTDIVKHMVTRGRLDRGEDLTIKYHKVRDRSSLTKHEKLRAACKEYERD